MQTRLNRAIAIKDTVVPYLRQYGKLERTENGPAGTFGEVGPFKFCMRTPFNKPDLEPVHAPRNYGEALLMSQKTVLGYQLDIWRGTKVMSFEWDDKSMNLISFRSGDWEEELTELLSRLAG